MPPQAGQSFESLAADLEETGALGDARRRRVFMLRLVERLPLSPLEVGWLEMARRFADGTATEADLAAARVDAWNSLEGRSCNFADPAVNRTRAVLCALFPDSEPDEGLDKIMNVEEFFVDAGGEEHQAVELLNTVFAPRAE
jgi:hypothetical protein